jgi:hypothetical protein
VLSAVDSHWSGALTGVEWINGIQQSSSYQQEIAHIAVEET